MLVAFHYRPATHTLTHAWVGPQDHAAGPESLDTGGAHASAVGHHGPAVARRDEAARPCELRVVRYASAVTVEARPMSRDPLQRRQLVRPLAALPPRYRVQDLRIPRACSRQCCRQAPQRRLSHSRRALVAASLAYRRHLVRGVSLVTEEGAIACAKVQAAPMYEVKLRPAISLAASRHFMHSTRLASRPRQSHLPRSGYGRAMR